MGGHLAAASSTWEVQHMRLPRKEFVGTDGEIELPTVLC